MAEFEAVTEVELAVITHRTERARAGRIEAVSAHYDPAACVIIIELSSGVSAAIPVKLLPELADAKPDDLAILVVEGRGFGLHIPALDVDLSIPQLFETHLGSTTMRRAQSRASASRLNGRRGGRPKKVA